MSYRGKRKRRRELQGEIAIDQAALTRCVAEGKTLRNRQQEMQSVDAACPLCLTPLSEDACGNISAHYDREIAAKLQEHSALQQNIRELQYEHDTLTAEIKRRTRSHTTRQRQAQQERGRLQQAQQQAEVAQRQLATAIPRRQELAHSLATDAFAVAQRTALAQVEAGIKALAYDEAARAQAYRQTQSLQRWQEQEAELGGGAEASADGRVGTGGKGNAGGAPASGSGHAGAKAGQGTDGGSGTASGGGKGRPGGTRRGGADGGTGQSGSGTGAPARGRGNAAPNYKRS